MRSPMSQALVSVPGPGEACIHVAFLGWGVCISAFCLSVPPIHAFAPRKRITVLNICLRVYIRVCWGVYV